VLAIASPKRSTSLPDVPTFSEAGMAGYQVSGWNCIVAPRGTPPQIIKRLNAEIVAGFSQPDVLERLRKQSIEPAAGSEPLNAVPLSSSSTDPILSR
jgi:tripartite-type tricarboxylate transporter receptor subunit TctC